ncbi:hypothetical protein HRbin11_00576 [bacterium HR11]|nr:hypothetical protein HRbin11_00576 [bacterium HR11]
MQASENTPLGEPDGRVLMAWMHHANDSPAWYDHAPIPADGAQGMNLWRWLAIFGAFVGFATPVFPVCIEADPAAVGTPLARPPVPRTGSARLDGTVYDTESRPIAGIRLVLKPRAEADVTFETVTDAQGRYSFDRLAGGYYDVLLRWGDRTVVQVTVWLAHGRAHRVDFYIDGQRLKADR